MPVVTQPRRGGGRLPEAELRDPAFAGSSRCAGHLVGTLRLCRLGTALSPLPPRGLQTQAPLDCHGDKATWRPSVPTGASPALAAGQLPADSMGLTFHLLHTDPAPPPTHPGIEGREEAVSHHLLTGHMPHPTPASQPSQTPGQEKEGPPRHLQDLCQEKRGCPGKDTLGC